MFKDLMATLQELGNMLEDVQVNHTDMHPEDVVEVLRNCGLKAEKLAGDIHERRSYILTEVVPTWTATQSGAVGMPAAKPRIIRPLPAIEGGQGIS